MLVIGVFISPTFIQAGDDFFGPVSANFIRPGRFSDSAASDDNHDVTMDSTAFSMHYRSLAASESGLELKTPTKGQLFFEEKTPTNSNTGSSMVVTLDKNHIKRSSVPVAEASGSHSSNDMSLVGEYPYKYDFDKLSPGLDAILVEGKNLLCVGVSDDITLVSPKRKANKVLSSVDLADNLVELGDSVREDTSCINSSSMLNGDESAAQNEFNEANSPHGMVLSGPSPNRFSTYALDAAANRDSHEPHNSSNQLSKVCILSYFSSVMLLLGYMILIYMSFVYCAARHSLMFKVLRYQCPLLHECFIMFFICILQESCLLKYITIFNSIKKMIILIKLILLCLACICSWNIS